MTDIQRRSAHDSAVEQDVLQSLAAYGKLAPGEILVNTIVIAKTERLTTDGKRIVRRHRLHPTGRIDADTEIGMLRRAARDAEIESDPA